MSIHKAEHSKLERLIAIGLAVIFIAAGIFGVVAGGTRHQWMVVLVGLISIWWGSVWIRVAYKRRRLVSGELLWPFRRT